MGNGNIPRSAKSTETNEDAPTERIHFDRIDPGAGRFGFGRECAHWHVPGAYPDAESSAEVQVSGPGRPVHWAPADRTIGNAEDYRIYATGAAARSHHRHPGINRFCSQALDAPARTALSGWSSFPLRRPTRRPLGIYVYLTDLSTGVFPATPNWEMAGGQLNQRDNFAFDQRPAQRRRSPARDSQRKLQ